MKLKIEDLYGANRLHTTGMHEVNILVSIWKGCREDLLRCVNFNISEFDIDYVVMRQTRVVYWNVSVLSCIQL